MKLYNNSQKTPQSESLHKVKTETVKHLVHKKRKRKGGKNEEENEEIHGKKLNLSADAPSSGGERYGRKNSFFYEITEKKFHTQNTQAGSWYTQRQLGSFYSIRF